MNAVRGSQTNLTEVAEEFRDKHDNLLREFGEMKQVVNSLKASMDGINVNTAQIAHVLQYQASHVIKTLLRAFVAMVSCCLLVIIVAVISITRMEFKGNGAGISISPQAQPN